MIDSEIKSQAFHLAKLRSERARVLALLSVLGSLLVLVLVRGGISLTQGHRGEAWPFALLLAVVTAYEALWLRFVGRAIRFRPGSLNATWTATIFLESLLPTGALFLQIHSSFIGPHRALTSPAVLGYFLFIILSTLHLNPGLSRLAGGFSAAGYAAVSTYVFLLFPEAAETRGCWFTVPPSRMPLFCSWEDSLRALWPGRFASMSLQLCGKRRTAPSWSMT